MSLCGNNMKNCVYLLFLTTVMSARGNEDLYEDSVYKDAIHLVKECGYRRLSMCLKEKALKFIERLPNNIDIVNGISIKQSESERASRDFSPISLPTETNEREAVLDKVLTERIVDYLRSHTLELKIPMTPLVTGNDDSVETGRDKGGYGGGGFGGGGGKKGGKKGKGGMGLMMMMFYMKSAAMYAIGLKLIGAVAFKALLVAKVALTIATIVALKKIVEGGKGGSATYEVIAHPAHTSEHHDHHDRNFNPLDLVYKGYKVGA